MKWKRAIITTPSFSHYQRNYRVRRKERGGGGGRGGGSEEAPSTGTWNLQKNTFQYRVISPPLCPVSTTGSGSRGNGTGSIKFPFIFQQHRFRDERVIAVWKGGRVRRGGEGRGGGKKERERKESIIVSKSFVSAPARKIKDEIWPRVITRKFRLCFTKNRRDKRNRCE